MEPAPSLKSGDRKPFTLLILGLKLSFLLIIKAGLGDPEPSLSYSAVGLSCWGLPMMYWVFLLHSPRFSLYVFLHNFALSLVIEQTFVFGEHKDLQECTFKTQIVN